MRSLKATNNESAPKIYYTWGVLGLVSAGLATYHGVKRNNGSVWAGVGWGLLGLMFPIITPAVAFAQGFGKSKG